MRRLRDLPKDAADRDLILTNVTLYWLTGTAGSSAQLCYESPGPGASPVAPPGADGVAVFPQCDVTSDSPLHAAALLLPGIVASSGGPSIHSDWHYSLKANPKITR